MSQIQSSQYIKWNSAGKNIGAGSHSLLHGIFLTPETEPGSPALQADSLLSEPPEKPPISRIYPQIKENKKLLQLPQCVLQKVGYRIEGVAKEH